MITLQTITTIELSSICDLSCKYCINRLLVKHPSRNAGIMTDEVFDKTLELLAALVDRGTQKEVNLNGNGESFLDPNLPERVARVRHVMGENTLVQLSTNGVSITEEKLKAVKAAGITQIDMSIHSAYHIRRLVPLLRKYEIHGAINGGTLLNSHNWAGQLEPENQVPINFRIRCEPLIEGRGYVQSEGNITPCCYDYRNLGVFGSVFDSDILSREITPYELCETCHQEIPEEILNQKEIKNVNQSKIKGER